MPAFLRGDPKEDQTFLTACEQVLLPTLDGPDERLSVCVRYQHNSLPELPQHSLSSSPITLVAWNFALSCKNVVTQQSSQTIQRA